MIIPSIIFKNLKIIFRSPFTILLLILSPILLMLVVGFTYSGTTLADTTVGLIETDKNTFDIWGVNFKEYSNGNYLESRINCVNDLKRGEVEICIDFNSNYDKSGNLINANINYYIDDTRPQISEILIKNFNGLLDTKTKEISTKTIEQIFDEVKDTVGFMKESKNLTSQIKDDLDLADKNIILLSNEISKANDEFDSMYPKILGNIDDLKESINNNQNSLDNLRSDFINLDDELKNLNNELPYYIQEVDEVIDGVESFSNINPLINNYIDVNELKNVKYGLEDLSDVAQSNQNSINLAINNLNSIPDSSAMIQNLNEMEDYANDVNQYFNLATIQIEEFSKVISQRKAEINRIDSQLDEKLNYFDDLSNKKASSITEPITKKYNNIFQNFSRVHQLAPIVVILVLLFIGLLLSNVIVSLEINSKAYFRNLISPISQFKFILSLFLTSFIIISVQILFLFMILNFFFGIKLFDPSLLLMENLSHILQIFIVVLHLLLVFILLGILLAYLFSSIQISILVTTFVMLFLFLLSNIIIPLNIMPSFFAFVLKYSPVVLGENLIRLLFFYPKYYTLNFIDLLVFYPISLILIIFLIFANKRRKNKLF